MTPEMRTLLTTASLWLAEAVWCNEENMRQVRAALEYEIVDQLLTSSRGSQTLTVTAASEQGRQSHCCQASPIGRRTQHNIGNIDGRDHLLPA
jgi:hypothetical protein